jgi:exonuclease SbcC
MIRSLILDNFRLHSHTELRFDSDGQIILVAGPNGVGKSSLLEAILFAFYGEGRHGKRNLDLLLRRGAELEGMTVELVFELDQTIYRINRRRDGRAVTAVLYGNDIPLMEGPNAVTEAIVRLLGMDAVGFKVAVIAQQKELDGLASLRPSDRAAAVRRLLRLDALTSAKDHANTLFRKERDLVRDLRPSLEHNISEETTQALTNLTMAQNELLRCNDAVSTLQSELTTSADVQSLWSIAVANRERANSLLINANNDLSTLINAKQSIELPDEPLSIDNVDELLDNIRNLERQIAEATAASRASEQRALVETELSRVRYKISLLLPQDELSIADAICSTHAEMLEAVDFLTKADSLLDEHKHLYLSAVAEQEAAQLASERIHDAGSTCESCGQEISDSHREGHIAELDLRLIKAHATVEELLITGRSFSQTRDEARNRLDLARQAHANAQEVAAQASRDAESAAELLRRERTYLDQLDRLFISPYDLSSLKIDQQDLDQRLTIARQASRVRADRAVALARIEELERSISTARQRSDEATREAAAAEVGGDLELRYKARLEVESRFELEVTMQRHWEREQLLAQERLVALQTAQARLHSLQQRLANHEQSAVDASNAALLLGDAADRLATRIRPMLEGTMSSLLTTMSDGRFDEVRIDDDYNVTVSDSGAFRPLSELSGGEMDLVALALRLSLSQAVADRTGSGVRFLILDECFGSQDPQRRASVLTALRGLRDTYRQIFLISHVENIEDSADVVIRVEASEDRSEAEVFIS